MTPTTTHAGLTLRGVSPAEVVDRRSIGYVNMRTSPDWRGKDPRGWLERKIEARLEAGAERIGLHLPGQPVDHRGPNPLRQWEGLSKPQAIALDETVEFYGADVDWVVNVGGLYRGVIPRDGWTEKSPQAYRIAFMAEVRSWAILLGGGVVFVDGMHDPHFHSAAMRYLASDHVDVLSVNRRPLVRLGAYIPEYGGDGKSVAYSDDTAPAGMTTFRHVALRREQGKLDLDHVDAVTREQHCWLNGQYERERWADGDYGYREADDPLAEELADRGWVFSTGDPAVLPRAIELTERGKNAAIKLLEQRERENPAKVDKVRMERPAVIDAHKGTLSAEGKVGYVDLTMRISAEAAKGLVDEGGLIRFRAESKAGIGDFDNDKDLAEAAS